MTRRILDQPQALRSWRLFVLAAVCSLTAACGLEHTVVMEPNDPPVILRATPPPKSAKDLGFVEASAQSNLDRVLAEFALRVLDRGGDYGKIDSVYVSFEVEHDIRKEGYYCNEDEPCKRDVSRDVERMRTFVVGRAFKRQP